MTDPEGSAVTVHDLSEHTDPTTERMRQETGHDCIACPSNVRNLMATAHNALGAFDAAVAGTGDWARAHRKMAYLRSALDRIRPVVDEHFEALKAWGRP